MKVLILTNGPGELMGWARPVVLELKKRGHTVSLWLLPCQFASGYEHIAASAMPLDNLEGPKSTLWTWKNLGREKADIVLQLGGDLFFGRRAAKAAKIPLFCYSYGSKKGMQHSKNFTAFQSMADKMPKPSVIGDLVKDSLHINQENSKQELSGWGHRKNDTTRVLLVPGSRPAIRRKALPWLKKITVKLLTLVSNIETGVLLPYFVPENELSEWLDSGLNPMKSESGAAMREADYALTQPGTNNLEMMHCGLPAITVAPLDFLKEVPIGGLAGLLTSVPLLGMPLKEHGIKHILNRHSGCISLVNRVAGRYVMDEMMGDISPEDIAEAMAKAIKDKDRLALVKKELLELSGDGGASIRLCDAMEKTISCTSTK